MNVYVDTHRYWNIYCVIMSTAVAPKTSTVPSPSPLPPRLPPRNLSPDAVGTTVMAVAELSTETTPVKVPSNGKMYESQTRYYSVAESLLNVKTELCAET